MDNLLYVMAFILAAGWAIETYGNNPEWITHLFLVMAVGLFLLRFIGGKARF